MNNKVSIGLAFVAVLATLTIANWPSIQFDWSGNYPSIKTGKIEESKAIGAAGDRYIRNTNEGGDIITEVKRNGVMTEVGREGPLFDSLRSIGTVGAVANDQGALTTTFLNGLGLTEADYRFWDLDTDDGATILEDSGQANANFTKSGTPLFDEKGFFGRTTTYAARTGALESTGSFFDSLDTNSTWTFSAFISTKDFSQTQFFAVYGAPGQILFDIRYTITNNTIGVASSSFASQVSVSREAMERGIHITLTSDGTTWSTYIDGQLAASDPEPTFVGSPSGSTPNLWVGGYFPSTYYPVVIQDLFFSKEELTASQVLQLASRRWTNTPQLAGGHELRADSFGLADLTDRISFWNMDDETDDSVNTLNLTNEGSVLFDQPNIFGVEDTAGFDGATQSLSILPNSRFIYGANASFTWGCYAASNNWNTSQILMWTGEAGSIDRALLRIDPGSVTFENDPPVSATATFSQSFTPGSYHYILGRLHSGKVDLFIDGRLVSSVNPGSVTANTVGNFRISGRRVTLTVPWNGRIDECFHANFALEDEEIRKLASSRIDHNKGLSSGSLIDWVLFGKGEFDLTSVLPFKYAFNGVVEQRPNSMWVDFGGFEPGYTVTLK